MNLKTGIPLLLILTLSLSVGFVPKITPIEIESVYIEPGLKDIDSASVDVIVTAINIEAASRAVAQVGGVVNSDLWLIDSVAASVPTTEIQRLSTIPGVRSIVTDKPVQTAETFPVDTPYAWDGWGSDRRVRLYEADVNFSGPLGTPPVPLPDGGAFVIQKDGDALIMNPDGTIRATFSLPDDPYEDPIVVGSDGVIYLNGNKTIHAINPDGTSKWDQTSTRKFEGGLGLYEAGSLLYAITRDDEEIFIRGLEVSDGEYLFSKELEDDEERFHCAPTPDSSGYAYIVNDKGTLYKISPTGAVSWDVELPGDNPFLLSPQIGADGTVYVPSEKGRITAVNPADGSQIYSFYRSGGTIQDPIVIASDGSAYGAFGNNHVYGINPDGTEKFDYYLNDHKFDYAPMLTLDEAKLIVAAKEKKVLALDTATGVLNWQFNTDSEADIKDNPIIAPNGNIHLGDYKGKYYILNPDGLRLFSYGGFKTFKSSPTISTDGTVFFHDDEKRMITLTRMSDEWDGSTPDVQPTADETVYRVLSPVSIDMGADILHENGIDGTGIGVAVVDSGVYFDKKVHRLLGGVVDDHFIGQIDFVIDQVECSAAGGVWNGPEGYCIVDSDNSKDAFGHGTHVAGIIWNNMTDYNTGVTLGVAPDASILSVRVLGDHGGGAYSDVIEGIQYVVANKDFYTPAIRVLNLSLSAAPTTPYFADPLNMAAEEAWAAGIVVFAAAGNVGPEAETITVPGNSPYVITIGALDSHRTPGYWLDDDVPDFSATGPTYDSFLKPDVLAPGANVVSFMHNGEDDIPYIVQVHPDYSEDTSLFRMNGTSMSAAAASGVAALMLEHDPSLTPDQIKFRLLYTAQQTQNEYGEIIDNIFQQGAGRIWSPAAVYADLPIDGQANVGMDINADLAHGWATEADLLFHYEGPVRKILSDDGSVYLYFVDAGDGTSMALGAADAANGIWYNSDELDDLAAVLPGGQMVWAGGQMAWAGGQMAWAGGQMIWAGGQMAWAGGQMAWAGGQMAWAGGQMIWAGGQMAWAGRMPNQINDDPIWIEGNLVWSGSETPWQGGLMTWEPGLIIWDGEPINPDLTEVIPLPWVNDDGSVEDPPNLRLSSCRLSSNKLSTQPLGSGGVIIGWYHPQYDTPAHSYREHCSY